MSDEQPDRDPRNFEETLRAIAAEVTKSAEKLSESGFGDLEKLARASGIDAEPLKQFADDAGRWIREQVSAATETGTDVTRAPAADATDPRKATTPPADVEIPLSQADAAAAGLAHPLDMPTEEQGRALAALDSGRWTVEPGTVVLATVLGRGEVPQNAHAVGMELHVRDWVDPDGDLTFAGGHALSRWLEASTGD